MTQALLDPLRHNAWATRQLLSFCSSLSPEQLNTTMPGVYGNVSSTLRHILGAEAYYRFLLVSSFPDWDWRDDELPTIEQMKAWATDTASFWKDLLLQPLDPEATLVRRHEDGSVRETRVGIVLAQALYHGTAHREQVCLILTSLGLQPPALQAWDYGRVSGRASGSFRA